MRPFTVQTVISAPREEIFDYLADLGGRVAYSDHYMDDFRLSRARSEGSGASAAFAIDPPLVPRLRCQIAVAEHERPRRLVEEGRCGRLWRSRWTAVYDLSRAPSGATRVELTIWTEPGTRFDALKESLGLRGWLRRQAKTALERLRVIFEERPSRPLARATVAGYEPLKAARYGGA